MSRNSLTLENVLYAFSSPLAKKQIGLTILLSSSVTLVFTLAYSYYTYKRDVDYISVIVQEVVQSRIKTLKISVWENQEEQIVDQLNGFIKVDELKYAAIYDGNVEKWFSGKVSKIDEVRKFGERVYKTPITTVQGGSSYQMGELVLLADIDFVKSRVINNYVATFIVNFFKTAVVAFFFMLMFHQTMSRHVLSISNYLRRYKPSSNAEHLVLDRMKIGAADELSSLVDSVNELVKNNDEYLERIDRDHKLILEQKSELEIAVNQLEEFAHRISHDLRAPIVSSVAMMELASEEKGNSDATSEYIAKTLKSLKSSSRLVDDLLGLSVINKKEEEEVEVEVAEMIDDSLEKLSSLEGFESIRIVKKYEFGLALKTKEHRIKTIIDNLISNSIKYRDPDETQSAIEIVTSENSGFFILEVHDNGLGIPPEREKDIFKMFSRFHVGVSFGSGLGMYLVELSAGQIGGSVEYRRPEKGCCFVLNVPLNR